MKHMLWVFWLKRRRIRSNVGLQDRIFARILTFENGLGCPEAILGSVELRDCLVNFAQSFKYTTGLSFRRDFDWISTFRKRTTNHSATSQKHHSFQSEKNMLGLKQLFVHSKSAIQSAIIP
jgi:8-amino-7-oxononanoate synthase